MTKDILTTKIAKVTKGRIFSIINFVSSLENRKGGGPRQSWYNSSIPIGVGNGFRRPRPPNRACGSPAHGSPVGGFLIGIGSPASRLYAW